MSLKKNILVLFTVFVMVFSVSTLVFAATPEPADNMQQTEQTEQQTGQVQQTVPVTSTQTAELENSKYLTKGGAAFWFIFTIILNLAVSFWVGNRFYRLSKKDSHISAEIRALRKDLDEKFSNSVGGFAEQEINIKNLNDSFAMNDDGIKPAEKTPVLREISDEEEERFRKWEEAQSRSRSERMKAARRTSERDESENDELKDKEIRRINRKNYQPRRSESDLFDSGDDADDLGDTKEIKISKGDNVKSKAKELLGDIFPFKED